MTTASNQEMQQAMSLAMTELQEARATLEAARQTVLEYEPLVDGADEWDGLRIAVDKALRKVLRFLGSEA